MEYHFFKRTSFWFMLVFFMIALLYFIAPAKYSLTITYYIICASILGMGIFKFTFLDMKLGFERKLDLYESIINIFVSVIAINFGQKYIALSIILGVIYLILPIIRLCIADYKVNQLFLDSFKFMAGFVLITSNVNFIWWIKYIIGAVYLAVSIAILVTKLVHLKKSKEGLYYE